MTLGFHVEGTTGVAATGGILKSDDMPSSADCCYRGNFTKVATNPSLHLKSPYFKCLLKIFCLFEAGTR